MMIWRTIQMSQMRPTMNERWRIACHEAGHAVACLALGGQCSGVMLHVDGGFAMVDGLYQDREAYAIASGPAAERLAEQFDAPMCEPIPLAEVAANPPIDGDPIFSRWTSVADVSGVNGGSESDDRKLALWSIEGRESEPDTWVRRLKFARHISNQIIEANREAILRVARELFERGAITGETVKQLFEGQNG